MSREGFEQWLRTPVEDLGVIENPQDMYDGWLWNGRRADTGWDSVGVGITPRDYFAERVEASCGGHQECGVLLYRDGALEAYLLHLGHAQRSIHTALLVLAATGDFKSEPAEDTALFWAETGANLWPADADGWLAVLSVGKGGARFVDQRDLTGVVAGLRPVESRFFELVERLAEDEEAWDWDSGEAFRSEAPRDPAFTDPAVLRES
ncbi:hypothetical protein BBK82_40825 [Lentzea guizhouensis]|uniref:Uncharacterized protein n=2 Tax=Lentzea guizhouensis TaxID=1586287 RepID=A0A1B2HUJ6_9PSEU|nr:hypothetical protein BBK82_40825 [Lentzea guizhouensis]